MKQLATKYLVDIEHTNQIQSLKIDQLRKMYNCLHLQVKKYPVNKDNNDYYPVDHFPKQVNKYQLDILGMLLHWPNTLRLHKQNSYHFEQLLYYQEDKSNIQSNEPLNMCSKDNSRMVRHHSKTRQSHNQRNWFEQHSLLFLVHKYSTQLKLYGLYKCLEDN